MNEKLVEFRKKKQAQNTPGTFSWSSVKKVLDQQEQNQLDYEEHSESQKENETYEYEDVGDGDYPSEEVPHEQVSAKDYYLKLTLKLFLWLVFLKLALYIEFAAIYVIVSIFFLMFWNLKTSRRRRGELSAYSVFNPNFQVLDGTLTASQFENEIRYGFGRTF